MVEPTTLTLQRSYGCYLRQNCHPLFHILLRPSPPSMANSEPTIVNITNGHPKKKKKSNHQLQPQKEKKFQSSIPPPTTQTHFHHSPSFKPQLQTLKTQTHQYKIFRSVIQNCQLKPTNTENPNPNPRILRSKSKIMKMRSGFLFLGIYVRIDEHGEWV